MCLCLRPWPSFSRNDAQVLVKKRATSRREPWASQLVGPRGRPLCPAYTCPHPPITPPHYTYIHLYFGPPPYMSAGAFIGTACKPPDAVNAPPDPLSWYPAAGSKPVSPSAGPALLLPVAVAPVRLMSEERRRACACAAAICDDDDEGLRPRLGPRPSPAVRTSADGSGWAWTWLDERGRECVDDPWVEEGPACVGGEGRGERKGEVEGGVRCCRCCGGVEGCACSQLYRDGGTQKLGLPASATGGGRTWWAQRV